MVRTPFEISVHPKVVAATLKGLRRHRRLSVNDAAAAMGMPRRSYLHFEAGGGKLNVDHLIRFAEVFQCDLAALLAAIFLQSPTLAVRCADNKMMTAMVLAALDFSDTAGVRMTRLTAADAARQFRAAFAALAATMGEGEAPAWLDWRRVPPEAEGD